MSYSSRENVLEYFTISSVTYFTSSSVKSSDNPSTKGLTWSGTVVPIPPTSPCRSSHLECPRRASTAHDDVRAPGQISLTVRQLVRPIVGRPQIPNNSVYLSRVYHCPYQSLYSSLYQFRFHAASFPVSLSRSLPVSLSHSLPSFIRPTVLT
jgi:hypothetical protein